MIHPSVPDRLVDDVRRWSEHVPRVRALAVVGSTTRSYVPKPANVDFLAITSESISLGSARRQFESQSPGASWVLSGDTIRSVVHGMPIGVALLDQRRLDARLRKLSFGARTAPRVANWAVGICPPEAFCADIADGEILFDHTECLSAWRAELRSYPARLRYRILSECAAFMQCGAGMCDHAMALGDYLSADTMLAQLLVPAIRGEFAVQRTYFRGLRYVQAQLDTCLSTMPPALGRLLDVSCPRASRVQATRELLGRFSDVILYGRSATHMAV